MRRHLPSARTGIVSRAHRLQQHVVGGRPQGQTESPVAIVGEKPVVADLQGKSRSHAHSFMPGTGNLEEYFLLPLQQNLAVIDPPRGIHVTIGFDQLIAGETFVGLAGFLDLALGYCGFRISLCGSHPTPLDASVRRCECKSRRGL